MSVDYSEKQRREMARTHFEVGHTGAGSLYFPYHGRRPRRHSLNLAHVSMVHAGHLSIVPSDCDRIPACFGDNATISGIASPINAGAPLEFLKFVDCSLLLLRCISLTERSCEATTPSPAERRSPGSRLPDAANPRVPVPIVASGELAELRRPRSNIGTSRLVKPHSQVQLTLFSVVEHQANGCCLCGRTRSPFGGGGKNSKFCCAISCEGCSHAKHFYSPVPGRPWLCFGREGPAQGNLSK